MSRRRGPRSRAEGKRFGTTSIGPEKSMSDIQGVLAKYDVTASQWTTMPDYFALRFRLDGRNYLFNIRRYADDEQETKRLLRVLYWYLDTMLAALDSDLFNAERVFLAFAEVAPDVTLSEAMEAKDGMAAIRNALGSAPLALEEARTDD